MRMRDSVKQFVEMRDALEAERQSIRERLAQLDQVLGGAASVEAPLAAANVSAPAAPRRRGRPPGGGSGSQLGMREIISQVTENAPLGLTEIVEAMKQSGYQFKSKNPRNSVGAYLYGPTGKKHFKRSGKGFVAK